MQHIKQTIGKAKVSQVLPVMKLTAQAWGLKLNRSRDFNTTKRIVVNSAKWN